MCLVVCMYANSMYVHVLYYISMFVAALTLVLREGWLLCSYVLNMERINYGCYFFVSELMTAYKRGCRKLINDVVLCIVLLLECVPHVLRKREWLVYSIVCRCGSMLYYVTIKKIKERTLTMFMFCMCYSKCSLIYYYYYY
jgi:hypothetical protein